MSIRHLNPELLVLGDLKQMKAQEMCSNVWTKACRFPASTPGLSLRTASSPHQFLRNELAQMGMGTEQAHGHGYGSPPLQQAMLILDRRGSGLSKFEETKLQIRNLDHRLFIHSLTLIRVTDRLHFQMAYPS